MILWITASYTFVTILKRTISPTCYSYTVPKNDTILGCVCCMRLLALTTFIVHYTCRFVVSQQCYTYVVTSLDSQWPNLSVFVLLLCLMCLAPVTRHISLAAQFIEKLFLTSIVTPPNLHPHLIYLNVLVYVWIFLSFIYAFITIDQLWTLDISLSRDLVVVVSRDIGGLYIVCVIGSLSVVYHAPMMMCVI